MSKLNTDKSYLDVLKDIDYIMPPKSIPYINNKIDPKKYYPLPSTLEKYEHNSNYGFIDLTYEERLIYLIGPPKATKTYSVEELENMGMIGLYRLKKI